MASWIDRVRIVELSINSWSSFSIAVKSSFGKAFIVKRSVFHGTTVFLLPFGNSANSAAFSFWKSLETFGVKVFADLEVRDRKKVFVFFFKLCSQREHAFRSLFRFWSIYSPIGTKIKISSEKRLPVRILRNGLMQFIREDMENATPLGA